MHIFTASGRLSEWDYVLDFCSNSYFATFPDNSERNVDITDIFSPWHGSKRWKFAPNFGYGFLIIPFCLFHSIVVSESKRANVEYGILLVKVRGLLCYFSIILLLFHLFWFYLKPFFSFHILSQLDIEGSSYDCSSKIVFCHDSWYSYGTCYRKTREAIGIPNIISTLFHLCSICTKNITNCVEIVLKIKSLNLTNNTSESPLYIVLNFLKIILMNNFVGFNYFYDYSFNYRAKFVFRIKFPFIVE